MISIRDIRTGTCLIAIVAQMLRSPCTECDILLSQYESATFELARFHNALQSAQLVANQELARKLKGEAVSTADRQFAARWALRRHRDQAHDGKPD